MDGRRDGAGDADGSSPPKMSSDEDHVFTEMAPSRDSRDSPQLLPTTFMSQRRSRRPMRPLPQFLRSPTEQRWSRS